MNDFKEYDEMDEFLFNYFEKHKQVPKETIEIVENTFKSRKKKSNTLLLIIKKIVMILISLGILSTSVVFAKDIYNFIISLFTNSTEAINLAVENNYVQVTDMEYVFDQNIGVKIDKILFDGKSLDISLMYKSDIDNNDITQIELYEYFIYDQNSNLIFARNFGIDNNIIDDCIRYNEAVKIENNYYIESLLYRFKNTYELNIIELKINSLVINYNNQFEIISGNWTIQLELNEVMKVNNFEEYKVVYNDLDIEQVTAIISETTLKIQIDYKNYDDSSILKNGNVALKYGNQTFYYNTLKINNNTVIVEYDIGLYNNMNNLDLTISNNSKTTTIKLYK